MSRGAAPDAGSMLTTDLTAHDVQRLREQVVGDVVAPGDADYATARLAWNLTAPQQPALVVVPDRPDDILATVRFAVEHGLRVAA